MYYNWNKILSYDAQITIVVGPRGIGKTYGIRKHCIKNDFLKRGKKYIEIVRYKNQVSSFLRNYFARLSLDPDLQDYEFKTEGDTGYIRKKSKDEKNKNEWQILMWCLALTDAQKLKTRTFDNVKRIIFDEFILDRKMKQFYKYLPCEVATLQDIIDTISRETEETQEKDKVRVIMLGNALDALNPYFVHFDLYRGLQKGQIKRFNNKRGVLHYVEVPDDYKQMKQNSVAFAFDDKQQADIAANNEFYLMKDSDFIVPKTERAKCMCNIRDSNGIVSLWYDLQENKLFCVDKEVQDVPNIAITGDVANTQNIIARRTNKVIKLMIDLYYVNCLFYDSKSTQLKVFNILQRYANI